MSTSLTGRLFLLSICLTWASPGFGATRWAILIGVNTYPKNVALQQPSQQIPGQLPGQAIEPLSWPDLKFAVADVRALRDALFTVGYRSENVIVIDSEAPETHLRPTHENIVTLLSSLSVNPQFDKDDSIMVVFTGHGFTENGESLLCPSDIDIQHLQKTGISVSWISDQLAKAKVAQRYLIIDACRNEVSNIGLTQFNMLTGLQKLALQKRGDSDGPAQGAPQGIFYFASCLAGQRSVEDESLGHGVFLHFFTVGLQGAADVQPGGDRNRLVSPYEAFNYAADETRRWTRKAFSWEQQPWVEGRSTSGLHLTEIPIDSHQKLLAEVQTLETQAPSAFNLQAQYDLELAILALHAGDRAEAVDRVEQAIKFDPTNVLARQTRSLLYLLETSNGVQQDEERDMTEVQVPAPNYEQALKEMRQINRPLLVRASKDVPLRSGMTPVATAHRGDVLVGNNIVEFGNQKWLEVRGLQRKGKTAADTEKFVAFVSLADLSRSMDTYDQLQEFDSRNQQPGYLVRGHVDGDGGGGGGGQRAATALHWVNFGLSIGGRGGSIPIPAGNGGGTIWKRHIPYAGRWF